MADQKTFNFGERELSSDDVNIFSTNTVFPGCCALMGQDGAFLYCGPIKAIPIPVRGLVMLLHKTDYDDLESHLNAKRH
jgi:hypothetical protein